MARPTNEQAAAKTEIGWSLDWNYATQTSSLIPMLAGFSLLKEMQMMADTDETVGSMLYCISSTLAQVDWKHVPQIDGKALGADKDPEAVKAADFADTLLVDMRRSFGDHVDDALTMIWAGFAPCEIVFKQRLAGQSNYSDGLWGLDDLPLRDPLTIWQWVYDTDRRHVLGARQMTYQGSAVIPMWKLCNYRTSTAADQPQGRPLLKSAHRAWRLKNRIQDSEAIGIERELCGLPIFRIPQSDIDTAGEKDDQGAFTVPAQAAQKRIQSAILTVQNVRMNKTGGLVIPSDTFASEEPDTKDRTRKWDFETLTSSGQRSIDARTAARDYDRAIARVVMMQFLHLGDRSSGSFGLSDDQSSMAIRSLMSLGNKIAQEFTRKVLPLAWSINGMDRRYLPALSCSNISKDGIQQVGAFLNGLAKNEWLIGTDTDARISALKTAGFAYNRDEQQSAANTAQDAAELLANPPPPPAMPAAPAKPNLTVAKSAEEDED